MEEKLKPTASSTDGQIWIIDLRSQQKIAVQFVPDELNVSRTVSIANINNVGKNNAGHHFTGGSKELSFKIDILADDEEGKTAKMRAKWLESLTYQDEATGKYPNVLLIWGTQYKNATWIVSKISFREKLFIPGKNFLPQMIEASITLLQDNAKNELVENVRGDLAW